MNKYLKGFVNSLAMLAIGFVGLLFSLNVLAFGFIVFPDLMARVDKALLSNPSWFAYYFVPGTLPLFFILTMICLAVLSMYATIYWIKRVDVPKIVKTKKA